MEQLGLFDRRIRLSQWSLDLIYVAIFCFVATSLLLAAAAWLGSPMLPVEIVVFGLGVAVLAAALALEFVEMSIALRTIRIEMQDADRLARGPVQRDR